MEYEDVTVGMKVRRTHYDIGNVVVGGIYTVSEIVSGGSIRVKESNWGEDLNIEFFEVVEDPSGIEIPKAVTAEEWIQQSQMTYDRSFADAVEFINNKLRDMASINLMGNQIVIPMPDVPVGVNDRRLMDYYRKAGWVVSPRSGRTGTDVWLRFTVPGRDPQANL